MVRSKLVRNARDVQSVHSRRGSMVTSTRARTYGDMVDALAGEGLPALQDTLAGLAPEDWGAVHPPASARL
jgi:hypothetical protein